MLSKFWPEMQLEISDLKENYNSEIRFSKISQNWLIRKTSLCSVAIINGSISSYKKDMVKKWEFSSILCKINFKDYLTKYYITQIFWTM